MFNVDLILSIINTMFSGISIILIIFGWIIPHKQSKQDQLEQREYDKSSYINQENKDLIDQQISILYVPLYTLALENKMQFNLLLKKLNRNYVFLNGQTIYDLDEDDKILWLNYISKTYISNLNRMKDLLNNNMHLFYNYEIPSCYQRFMQYVIELNNNYELYLDSINNNCNNLLPENNYPYDFDIYINKTLNKLLNIQKKFLDQNFDGNSIVQKIFDKNIINDKYGETVIITDQIEDFPYLCDSKGEKITINTFQFIVGTDKNRANFIIHNNNISRLHAMFIKENDKWYIIDLGSKNNTYLEEYVKVLLHNNDNICFTINFKYQIKNL